MGESEKERSRRRKEEREEEREKGEGGELEILGRPDINAKHTSATLPRSPFSTASALICCTLRPVALAMAFTSKDSPIPNSRPSYAGESWREKREKKRESSMRMLLQSDVPDLNMCRLANSAEIYIRIQTAATTSPKIIHCYKLAYSGNIDDL